MPSDSIYGGEDIHVIYGISRWSFTSTLDHSQKDNIIGTVEKGCSGYTQMVVSDHPTPDQSAERH